MVIRRKINRKESQDKPHLIWNAFVDVLATSEYVELSSVQQIAYLAFWYDSEVQNGGHLQFFENSPNENFNNTLKALEQLNAKCQQKIFDSALTRWQSIPRENIETVEEFISEALEGEFSDFDNAYYGCQPELTQILEEYLNKHTDEFIGFEE
jgi:hypothetical protein